jgi:sugar phosphate isomerase/epimerase
MPLAAFPKCFLPALVEGSMPVERWIDLAAGLGVDGLEFYWGFTPHGDPASLRRLRELAGGRGLEIPMMCYSSDFTVHDVRQRAEEVRRQVDALRVTEELGGRYCRVLSGQRRPGVAREDGVRWTVEAITELLGPAEEHRVVLVLENHFKDGFWTYPEFAQRSEVFLEILDAIPDSPYFGVNYDPSNALVAGDDPVTLLRRVAPRVRTMHASDRRLRPGAEEGKNGAPSYDDLIHGVIGTGSIPFEAIFAVLRENGFDGWISIEDGDDPRCGVDHLQRSAAFLRDLMRRHGVG